MLSFLFTTLKRSLGTEDTKQWSFSGVILSDSSCKQILRCAIVRDLRCLILRFKNGPHVLYWGLVGTAGRPVQDPQPLLLQPCLWEVCRMRFWIILLNMHGCPWKRWRLEGSICCPKISTSFSALLVPSQKYKLPLSRAVTQPHTMTDPGFWTCCW